MSGYATQEKAAVIVSSGGTLNTNKHNNNLFSVQTECSHYLHVSMFYLLFM